MAALTPKQRRFVAEYLIDNNAAGAYRRAGYTARNANVAKVEGHRLLTKPNIRDAIAAAQNRRAVRTETKADSAIRELSILAFSRMRSFVKWGPAGVTLKDSDLLTEDQDACVAEVSQTVTVGGGTIKFKLHNKADALDKIFKHLGLYDKLPALEKLLDAMPPELAEPIRLLFGDRLPGTGSSPGGPPAPANPSPASVPPVGGEVPE